MSPVTGTPASGGTLWCEVAEADQYFATRHGLGTLWSDLSGTAKTALLTTAQGALQHHNRWKFTDSDGDALEVSQSMKDAVCEQVVVYLLDPDEDRRSVLRAQGVVSAGLIQETYGQSGVTVSPRAADLLRGYEDPRYNTIDYE